jgi:hypothetical protein
MNKLGFLGILVGLLTFPVMASAVDWQKPYFMKHIPTVAGTVEAVDEHSFTLATDAGEHMKFEYDSHTLMPATFGVGTIVWLEFATMEDGGHRAIRVSSIGQGEVPQTMQGERPRAEMEGYDADAPVAMAGEPESDHYTGANETPSAEAREEATEKAAHERAEAAEEAREHESTLPQTASPWPLAQGLGGMLFGSGATLWFARRRRGASSK